MATEAEINRVRRSTNVDEEDYSDSDISGIIDALEGNLNLASAQIWEEKAAKYSELVDTSESGSSRKQSSLFENAVKMVEYYTNKADEEEESDDLAGRARTRLIVRL